MLERPEQQSQSAFPRQSHGSIGRPGASGLSPAPEALELKTAAPLRRVHKIPEKSSGFRVQDSRFRVQGLGCRVQGLGFRVEAIEDHTIQKNKCKVCPLSF